MEGLSEIQQQSDHMIVRTPGEPDFWFGNFVMFDGCPDDPLDQIAAFEAAFPVSKHKLIAWDDPTMVPGAGHAVLRGLGYEIDVADVLTLNVPLVRATLPDGIVIRPVRGDAEWDAVVDLQNETGIEEGHDKETHRPYVENRFAAIKRQCEAGVSCWFGAWDGDVLAGDLGIMSNDRMARYRSVETRQTYRRRGLCPALLCAAHDWAKARSPDAVPIIVAMADSAAGRIYRRCGFARHEVNISALLKGY